MHNLYVVQIHDQFTEENWTEYQKTIVSRSVYVKNIPSFGSYWNDDSTQCTAILQDIYNLLRESDHFVIDFSWIKELAQDRIHA